MLSQVIGRNLRFCTVSVKPNGLAPKGARLAEVALVAHAEEAQRGPDPGDAGDDQHDDRGAGQEGVVQHDADHRQDDGQHDPGIGELRILAWCRSGDCV